MMRWRCIGCFIKKPIAIDYLIKRIMAELGSSSSSSSSNSNNNGLERNGMRTFSHKEVIWLKRTYPVLDIRKAKAWLQHSHIGKVNIIVVDMSSLYDFCVSSLFFFE